MKVHAPADARRIAGVQTKPLRTIPDERGWLMEILRRDETDLLPKFGQVYVSEDHAETWRKLDRELGEIRAVCLSPG